MNQIKSIGLGKLTIHGKAVIAESMYAKGKSFLGAAVLLRQKRQSEADTYVFLHLLCQSVELILKSILLAADYDGFHPELTKLGHKLLKIADATIAATAVAPMRAALAKELHQLDQTFASHRLRYGSGYDILVNPDTISYRKVLSRIVAVIRFIEKKVGVTSAISNKIRESKP